MLYFQGDKVMYRGSKFPELRTKIGEVCGRVQGSTHGVVVDYGNDSYVMDGRSLVPYKPSKEPNAKEPEVQVRRKPADPDLD